MNLKQQLIKETLTAAGEKIAVIARYAGLIAGCEALGEQLRRAAPQIDMSALVTVHSDSITARVSCFSGRASDVLQAIKSAGLLPREVPPADYLESWPGSRTFRIAGLDVTVDIVSPAAEIEPELAHPEGIRYAAQAA